jgi:hypothetical protein
MRQKAIGLVFIVLGLGIIAADPVVSLQCTRTAEAEAFCSLSVKLFGVIPVRHMEVEGVVGAEITGQTVRESDVSSDKARMIDIEQLVLNTRAGSVRPAWMVRRQAGGNPGYTLVDLPSFSPFASDLNQLLEYGTKGESVEYRAVTWIPIIVGIGFTVFGFLALWPVMASKRRK